MTDINKQTNRIPAESLRDQDTVSSWNLPSISKDGKIVYSAEAEKRKRQAEKIEDIPKPQKSKILTADELEQISKDAYQEGFQEGKRDGMVQGQEEGKQKAYVEHKRLIDEEKNKLQAIANALFAPLQDQQQQLENAIIDIAVQLAKHILQQEISSDPSVLFAVVDKALAALPAGSKNIKLFMNPNNAEMFKEAAGDIRDNWTIVGDPHMAPGGCRVETYESVADFSFETRVRDYIAEVQQGGDKQETEVQPMAQFAVPEIETDHPLPEPDSDPSPPPQES